MPLGRFCLVMRRCVGRLVGRRRKKEKDDLGRDSELC